MAFTNCLTLRGIKGSALTHAELDNNFICLDSAISNLANSNGHFLPLSGGTLTGPLSACTAGIYINDLFACDPDTGININSPVTIYGGLTVWGSATTLNTQIINSEGNIIYLNVSGNTTTAQGGGIVLIDGVGPGTDASIVFSGGCWHIEPAICSLTLSGDTNIWGNLLINGSPISFGGTGFNNILVSATTADNYTGISDPLITGYSASYVYITTFDSSNTTSGATININSLGVLDITKVGEEGLVPLDPFDILSGVTYYLIYNGDNMQLLTSEPVNNPVTYTTFMGPTTIAVGGAPVGTTFSAATVQQVFDRIFYTYQSSTFTAFYIQQLGTSPLFEVGRSISGGSYNFLWSTSYPANVKPGTIIIKNNVNAIISTPVTGMTNDGNEVISIPTITNTGAGSYTWKVSGTRTNNSAMVPRNYSATWKFRRYWGNSVDPIPTSGMVITLSSQDLNGDSKFFTPGVATSAFPFSGAPGTYKYICYPSTTPAATLFQDNLTLLNMAMADPTDGFTNPTPNNNWYYYSLPIMNQFGIVNTYKCFRSKYQLGSAINIRVT